MPDDDRPIDDGKLTDEQQSERFRNAEMRKMREKVAELENRLEEKKWDMNDDTPPQIRGLVMQLRQTRDELAEVSRIALRRPDDDALEPFMQRVLDDNPELERAYPNRIKRLEVVRSMARGIRVAEEEDTKSIHTGRGNATPARVHLTGGGPSASRRSHSKENDWSDFQAKMRDPKLTSEQKKELADRWDSEHPEE